MPVLLLRPEDQIWGQWAEEAWAAWVVQEEWEVEAWEAQEAGDDSIVL